MSEQFEFDAEKSKLTMADPGRSMPPMSVETSQDEPHLLDYVRVVYKRRWLAATAFLVVLLAVTVYTFTATPIYQAKVQLLIEADDQNVVSFQQVIEQDQAKADYYQTQYQLLQSRTLARKTVDSLKLWDREEFGGGAAADRKGLVETVKGMFGSQPVPSEAPAADETADQARFLTAFLENLRVSPIRNSRLVDVSFRSKDPKLAAAVVNALAKNYIEQNLEYKFMASKEASDWLGERLAEQRTLVEAAESKLQQYREQNDAISLEDSENIVVQKLTDLNAAVTEAKTERFQKEALYRQLESLRANSGALDSFPAILSNTFIQQQKAELARLQSEHSQMSERLGEKHPDIIKIRSAIQLAQNKLQGEIGKVVQSVRNEYQSALAKENSLVGALNQQKNVALSMNRKAIDYNVLERDVQSNKQLYESLLQRTKETGISAELKTSNIRIVDAAESPTSPVSPRRSLNLLIGLLGGAFLGVGLTFFFDYLDNRIKTPDEIKQYLGLAPLGLIPSLKDSKRADPLINEGAPPNFVEAFRTVRTNVLFSSADEGSRSIVVTSTGPGEGKTLVTTNLAIGFAQAGQRVLLVDADMRRPRVNSILGLPQEPGLSDLMVGAAKASETVRKTKISGLWVLAAGKIPPNPAELLGSARFREFLKSLSGHFDWVIIDSPPVMAVADSTIVANAVSGVVFVVGSDMTSRHGAKAALDQLEHARARFVGAVLNNVDLEGNSFYYAQYYKKEYARYYLPTGTHN